MQTLRLRTLTTVGGLMILAATLPAQTLTGTVQSNGTPVVGATVRLLELDRLEHTGAHGEFTFADVPKGTYQVFVSIDGYAAVTHSVDVTSATATTRFDLKPSAVPLKEIVISASPLPKTSDQEYQAADSKSQVDFDNTAGTSFAEKIDDLPGVNARWNGSAPSRPILRGLGDNEVLVLENGLRMGDIATYDPAHATPLDALEITQIDVVRGPAAILYGPNTLGGLVNAITNIVPTLSDHAISGTAAIEGNENNDEYSGYLRNVWSTAHSAFSVSAGTLDNRNIGIPANTYLDPSTGGVFNLKSMPSTDQHILDGGAGYSYQNTFGMIGIGAKHFETDYGVTGDPPNADWETDPPTTSRISQQRNTIELRSLFNTLGSVFDQVRVTGSYNDYTHSEFPTAQDSSGVSDPQANHFHKQEFNGVLQFRQHPLGPLSGTIGLWTDLQDLTIEGQQPLGPNSFTTGLAAYAYEELRAAQHTSVQAGVRYDYNHIQTRPYLQSQDTTFQTIHTARSADAFTASLGVDQDLGLGMTGSFNLARSFRPPTVQELYANGLDASSGTYSIGDDKLGAESGYGIDPSLRGTYNHVEFEVSPYLNYIDHYIFGYLTGDTIDAFPVRQFATTNARLWGYEVALTVEPVDHISLMGSSDYVNAEDLVKNTPLPFIPPLRGLLRATYQDQTYMGMIEVRLADNQDRLGAGDTPTSGYRLLNTGFGVRIPDRRRVHNISIHCDNVFNTTYRDNLSVVKTFLPQPGRAFRVNYELVY